MCICRTKILHKQQSFWRSVSNASLWKISPLQQSCSAFFLYSAITLRSVSLLLWAIPNLLLSRQIVLVCQWGNLEYSNCLALGVIRSRTFLATFAERDNETCASLYKKASHWTEGDFKTPPKQVAIGCKPECLQDRCTYNNSDQLLDLECKGPIF